MLEAVNYNTLLFLLLFSITASAQSIQLGSYTTEKQAQTAANRFARKGLKPHILKSNIPGIGTRYRVRAGVGDVSRICQIQSAYLLIEGEQMPKKLTPCQKQKTAAPPPPISKSQRIVTNAWQFARARAQQKTPRVVAANAFEYACRKVR